jgi:hypothetical protein
LKFALAVTTILGCWEGVALAQSNKPPCPTDVLAPFTLAPPDGDHCKANGCLVEFPQDPQAKKYKWWTAFTFNKSEGYYNGGLGTIFAPEHVSILPSGMLLTMAKDWNGNKEWAGAEAVLMFNTDMTEPDLGYGEYLVTAELVSPPAATWADYDPNVAFGLFTFERPATGTDKNPAREIDLAEISRWGWNQKSPVDCPIRGKLGEFDKDILCHGNAQFALQVYTEKVGMVKRYDVGSFGLVGGDVPIKEITLVMTWKPGEVTFEKYHGAWTFANLPAKPDFTWTTPTTGDASLKDFVPEPRCERFHINLWLGNYIGKAPFAPHDGPTNNQSVGVLIKNFEYTKARPPK